MNATQTLPGFSTWEIAKRCLAINATLSACTVATAAGIYSVVTYKSPYQKKRALLSALAGSTAVSTDLLMILVAADNPADLIRAKLLDPEVTANPELSMALRKAFVLTF